jgi:ADP-ribose pyrophosphatase YjhB (NUDIX family)
MNGRNWNTDREKEREIKPGRGRERRDAKPPERDSRGPPERAPGRFGVIASTIVRAAGEILLMRRKENGSWECPGGVVKFGEPIGVAAARELFEETGIRTRPGEIRFSSMLEAVDRKKKVQWISVYFLLSLKRSLPVRLSPEHTEYGWFPLGKLPIEREETNKRALSLAFPEKRN